MLETRDNGIIESLVSRDRTWLKSLDSYSQNLKSMYQEQVNMRETLESIGKRQCELTKTNAQIIDWAMTTMAGKKKVLFPKINISDYVPYIIVPPDVQDFVITYG